MTEIWKSVVGFETTYEVSNLGRVRRSTGGQGCRAGKIMSNLPHSHRGKIYYRIRLHQNGIGSFHSAHRLVATAFIPNPEVKPQINHKDGVPTNNVVDNLEWATGSENCQHAYDTGLRVAPRNNVRFTEQQVVEIRRRYNSGEKMRALAREFKTGGTTISHIVRYDYWKHVP